MGYIRHHAIVATTWNREAAEKARAFAKELFPECAFLGPAINGYLTIFIPPDGSKEGWDDSDLGDDRREQFIAYLKTFDYEDGSTPFDWAEIQYGDEDADNKIIRCSR